jgi:hypothetical protein
MRSSVNPEANLIERRFARLVYGTARDVVLIDADCPIHELDTIDREVLTAFHDHAGWDITSESGRYVVLVCRPHTPCKAGARNPRRP